MGTGFVALPEGPRYRLANASVPACLAEGLGAQDSGDGLVRVDIDVAGDRIVAISPAGTATDLQAIVSLGGAMVWPAFADIHTHLDKGHIWPRHPNPDGTFEGALQAAAADRAAHWTSEDVRLRMDFALRSAFAHGTALIRTHLDSEAPQHDISWPVFAEMRAEWEGLIALQGASLVDLLRLDDEIFAGDLADMVARTGGVWGAVTYPQRGIDVRLDQFFRIADDRGFAADLHVDESLDRGSLTLESIADAVLRNRFAGPVLVGHCCSLAMHDTDTIDRVLDKVAAAGIAVVSLPMCNMYLQDRGAGTTPRRRGVTLLHEMKARGIAVAVASDNTRDPFHAYGDLDALEVFGQAVRTCHFDHPFGDWPAAVARAAADIAGRRDVGRIAVGGPADLVVCRGRDWAELLARPQSDRTVIRAGRAIDTELPDYRELDGIVGRRA